MSAPQEGGSENKGVTEGIQKSSSRPTERECAKGGHDQESRVVG